MSALLDRVDGQAAERVVGSKVFRLADRLQAALSVLDVHVVESCVHNVNADKYSVSIAFYFLKEKYFIRYPETVVKTIHMFFVSTFPHSVCKCHALCLKFRSFYGRMI